MCWYLTWKFKPKSKEINYVLTCCRNSSATSDVLVKPTTLPLGTFTDSMRPLYKRAGGCGSVARISHDIIHSAKRAPASDNEAGSKIVLQLCCHRFVWTHTHSSLDILQQVNNYVYQQLIIITILQQHNYWESIVAVFLWTLACLTYFFLQEPGSAFVYVYVCMCVRERKTHSLVIKKAQ